MQTIGALIVVAMRLHRGSLVTRWPFSVKRIHGISIGKIIMGTTPTRDLMWHCTIHAEKAVVKELGDRNMMRGAIMYVIRISRSKTLVGNERVQNSEPCHDCHLFLTKCHEKYGLRKVFYSTHEFVELDFEDRPDKRPPMDLGRPPTWVRK